MQIINRVRPRSLPTGMYSCFIYNGSKLPKCTPSASSEQFPIAQKILLSQAFFQYTPFLNFTQYFLFCLLLFIVMIVFADLERFSHIVPGIERVQKSPKSLHSQCLRLQSLSLAVFKKKIENIGQNIFVRTGKGNGIHNPQYPFQPHFPSFQCIPHMTIRSCCYQN